MSQPRRRLTPPDPSVKPVSEPLNERAALERSRVLDLSLKGLSQAQISRETDIPIIAVRRHLRAIDEELRDDVRAKTLSARRKEEMRLDRLWETLFASATEGDGKVTKIDRLLHIHDKRVKLLGLDKNDAENLEAQLHFFFDTFRQAVTEIVGDRHEIGRRIFERFFEIVDPDAARRVIGGKSLLSS